MNLTHFRLIGSLLRAPVAIAMWMSRCSRSHLLYWQLSAGGAHHQIKVRPLFSFFWRTSRAGLCLVLCCSLNLEQAGDNRLAAIKNLRTPRCPAHLERRSLIMLA